MKFSQMIYFGVSNGDVHDSSPLIIYNVISLSQVTSHGKSKLSQQTKRLFCRLTKKNTTYQTNGQLHRRYMPCNWLFPNLMSFPWFLFIPPFFRNSLYFIPLFVSMNKQIIESKLHYQPDDEAKHSYSFVVFDTGLVNKMADWMPHVIG